MTKEELAEIRERINKATPGPWEQNQSNVAVKGYTLFFTYMANRRDAVFIAHARQDVPALLDEVERLQLEKNDLQRLRPLEEWGEEYGDVLWWTVPISEPPYCGNPLCSDWPGYHTHWSKLPRVE